MIDSIVAQRYRIVRLLGKGGMGSVYEARDTITSARVAVKLITAETAQNATLMGRFQREARATMPLDTPHIVKILDAGTDSATGLPFLVMELLEGEDMAHLLKRLGPLPPELALRIVAQACLGLSRAHEARLIHRDIKPANVFLAKGLDDNHVVKLLDFGVAKVERDPDVSKTQTAGLTRTGSMLGSPLYMAPEQARGLKDIDGRADVWSMGIVLYQALTGRTPHHDRDALGELIIAICTEAPTPLQELAPWVSPAVAAVVHGALRFDPEERFPTVAAMLDVIRPLLPHGWAIDGAMFKPLDPAVREQVAPRFQTLPDTPSLRGSKSSSGELSRSPSSSPQAGMSLQGTVGPAELHLTTGALPSSSSSLGAKVAASLLAMFGGGLLSYSLVGSSHPPVPVAAATGVTAQAVTDQVTPKPRTVRLVILPEDAAVELDGSPVSVKEGVIEITGGLGTVHEVRLSLGGEQTSSKVVVTENGSMPAKMQLELKTPMVKSATPPSSMRPAWPKGSAGGQPDLRWSR